MADNEKDRAYVILLFEKNNNMKLFDQNIITKTKLHVYSYPIILPIYVHVHYK